MRCLSAHAHGSPFHAAIFGGAQRASATLERKLGEEKKARRLATNVPRVSQVTHPCRGRHPSDLLVRPRGLIWQGCAPSQLSACCIPLCVVFRRHSGRPSHPTLSAAFGSLPVALALVWWPKPSLGRHCQPWLRGCYCSGFAPWTGVPLLMIFFWPPVCGADH